MIHAASAAAVHSHSGCVVTVTVPAPPLALIAPVGPASETRHFGAEGPVTDSVDVEPQAETKSAATMSGMKRTMGEPQNSASLTPLLW